MNSPLALVLISGVVIGGGAKIYSDQQAATIELAQRRSDYVEVLAELQHRVSQLQQADSLLKPYIGSDPTFQNVKPVPEPWPERGAFDRACLKAGKIEADVIAGLGNYVPTAPAYRGVDILTLAARLERLGGVPDIQVGALRLIRTLDVPPEALWLFVRSQLPILTTFVTGRHLLYTNGQLPLPAGATLTERQEAMLGIPDVKPSDYQRILRQTEATQARLEGSDTNTMDLGR